MNNSRNTRQLLEAVLSDEDCLQSIFLERTLQAVGKQKRARQRHRRTLGAAFLVLALLMLCWWQWPKPTLAPAQSPAHPPARLAAYATVLTAPPVGVAQVSTRADSVPIVASSEDGLSFVQTEPAPNSVRKIDDQQLLALLSGHPAALVEDAPGHHELVFVNATDYNGFPMY